MTSNAFECKHGTVVPKDLLDGVPEGQQVGVRHLCAACAFNAGARWVLRWVDTTGAEMPPEMRRMLEEPHG